MRITPPAVSGRPSRGSKGPPRGRTVSLALVLFRLLGFLADVGGGRDHLLQLLGRVPGFLLRRVPDGGPAHILAVRVAHAEAELAVLAFDQLNGALARL